MDGSYLPDCVHMVKHNEAAFKNLKFKLVIQTTVNLHRNLYATMMAPYVRKREKCGTSRPWVTITRLLVDSVHMWRRVVKGDIV